MQADGALFRGDAPVDLPPKELAALRLLLAHAGQIVTHSQLQQALWGDMHIAADTISKCISSLRAKLEPEECIQTVYKRGYRFSAAVWPHRASFSGALPRLAIMPFVTELEVPEYLGSAVAEQTAARLNAAHPAIASVLAQDSVFTLASSGLNAQQIGQTLEADLVLTGTLRLLPAHYRLRAEMIRATDGVQLWVEDLFVERSRIAGLEVELVNSLSFHLHCRGPSISAVADVPAGGPENDPQKQEAYEIFQRAHYEWQTLQRHHMQDGLRRLLRAIELDPSLIAARVDLANLCVTQTFYGFMSPSVAADIVRRAVEPESQSGGAAGSGRRDEKPGAAKGVSCPWDRESIPDLALRNEDILPALGWIKFHVDRDLPAALRAFSLSFHLPHNPWTIRARTMFSLSRHRFGEAIEALNAAIYLDPYSLWLQARLGWALHLAGEAAASIRQIERALTLFPKHESTGLYGSLILAYNGDAARGVELAQELTQRCPYLDLATSAHAYALACAGHADEARTILQRLEWLSRERFVLNAFAAGAYVALGERDAALAELRKSDQVRCPWFFQMLADPRLQPLHEDPEFVQMKAVLTDMETAAAQDARQP